MSGIVNSTGAVSGIIGTTVAPAVGTGTDGYVFTATGAGVDPAWEAVAGGGVVLQVVSSGVGSGNITVTNSSTFQAASVGQAITFTAGNKILALATCGGYLQDPGNRDMGLFWSLSTNANNDNNDLLSGQQEIYTDSNTANDIEHRVSSLLQVLFSPAGTSVTVTIKMKAKSGSNAYIYNDQCMVTLMEISV